MKKSKIATALIIMVTLVLAGIAIFTAVRLYQLRQQSVAPNAPESVPFAWDCSKYTFSLSAGGNVSVNNTSTRNEAAQQAKVYINGSLLNTFDVPALSSGKSADLGNVTLPQTGSIQWKIQGTKDCSNSGNFGGTSTTCTAIAFTISNQPSPTPTVTATPTPEETTPTPTVTATATSVPTPTSTYVSTTIGTQNPTPTPASLPNSGVEWPTIVGAGVGIFVVLGSLLLAL